MKTETYKVVIVDDEKHNIVFLKNILQESCKGYQVVGSASDVPSAQKVISLHNPDLVFLDIQMPGGNGLSLVDDESKFETILVTGYDHYAIEAIKHGVLDYILKPIDIEMLQLALQRFENRVQRASESILKVSTHQGTTLIEPSTIISIASVESVLEIKTTKGNFYDSRTLSTMQNSLPTHDFFRVNRSTLVNVHKIEIIQSGRGGNVRMVNGDEHTISYRRKPELKKLLGL